MAAGRGRIRSGVAGVVLAIVVGASPVGFPSDPPPDDRERYPEERLAVRAEAGALTWERIWYRAGSRARFKPYEDSGDLALFDDAIEFLDRKQGWWIPFERIARVEFGRMRGNQEVDWILLALHEPDPAPEVAIRDGGAFGFGHRTREIHARLEERLRAAGAAQWNVAEGLARFDGLEHQVSFTVPAAWDVRALETVYRDGVDAVGTLRVGPRREGPAILAIRREGAGQKRCPSLPARVVRDLRREVASSEAFLAGRVDEDAVSETPESIGGCEGVRLRAAGGGRRADVRAVADRGTVFLFAVAGPDGEADTLAPELERLVKSVSFPVLRWAPPH